MCRFCEGKSIIETQHGHIRISEYDRYKALICEHNKCCKNDDNICKVIQVFIINFCPLCGRILNY